MKKIFIAIIISLISSQTLQAANFNWKKIVKTESGESVHYIDTKTVYKVGSYKFFWLLTDYIIPGDDPENSVITHVMVNCGTMESRPITFTSFVGNMGRDEIDMEFILPEANMDYFQWIKYDPKENAHGVVLEKVCKRY